MRYVEVGARRAVKLSDADVPAIREPKKFYDESFLCLSGTLKKMQVKVRLSIAFVWGRCDFSLSETIC